MYYRVGQYTYNECVILEKGKTLSYISDLVDSSRQYVATDCIVAERLPNTLLVKGSLDIDVEVSDYVETTKPFSGMRKCFVG